MYIHQLFSNGKFKPANILEYEFKLTYMQINTLRVALPKEWFDTFYELSHMVYLPGNPHNFDKYKSKTGMSRIIYQAMMGDILLIHTKMVKWNQELHADWDIFYFGQLHRDMRKFTNYTKMRDFQYRLLQRSLVTNILLEKWGIKSSAKCNFCDEEDETVLHLLLNCKKIKGIWENFVKHYQNAYSISISIDAISVVTSYVTAKKGHIVNVLSLFLKQYIYRCRCLNQTVVFDNFLRYVNKVQNMEKYIAIKNNNETVYYNKWQRVSENSNENYVERYILEM